MKNRDLLRVNVQCCVRDVQCVRVTVFIIVFLRVMR